MTVASAPESSRNAGRYFQIASDTFDTSREGSGARPDLGVDAIEMLRNMVDGATHYDPGTMLPQFQPIWKWNGKELVQQNEPLPGQAKRMIGAVDEDDEEQQEAELTLFGAA